MNRTFLRLWLLSTVLFALGLIAYEIVQWTLWSDREAVWYERLVRGGYVLAARDVAESPDRAATLAALHDAFGAPVQIAPMSALDDTSVARLWAGDAVVWAALSDTSVFAANIPGTDEVVAIGPYGSYPLPWLVPRFGLLAIIAGLLALVSWLSLRPLDRGQRALAATAARIADGDLAARMPTGGAAATPGMARAFDAMADRLQALIAGQQDVLRAASHELRTPIARLRIGIHLLAEAADRADRERRAARLDEDIQELDDLVDEVLLHARLEPGGAAPDVSDVDVEALVARVFDRVGPMVGDVAFRAGQGVCGARVRAAPRLVERALRNLVLNAARYAQTVEVSVVVSDGLVSLIVDDDGPGIARADRERALLPFVRLDTRGGHGLGLSIVARIARWHGGAVELTRAPAGGLRVTVSWPQRCDEQVRGATGPGSRGAATPRQAFT